ncbi:MAG: DUF3784 domain-containing protein [Exiguobacterium chiriqhucha]|uniref:DUF3784 domain-containing protein n=1 Tax=Exiguobacterium chiriqhucha TaxID=1385984 RepID=UPI00144C7131|nr:DUF3784 domain-containing protein [Exiguobacterium chiriqhucha]KAB2860862.1 MAG: DUF3784 domain-containing protein [Exiguobacterium chiriqhucha]
MWGLVIAALILSLLGFAVHRLGWHFLISGYNTMKREDKARVNIKAVARLIGFMCYGIATIFLVIVAIDVSGLDIPLEPLFLLIVALVVVTLWRAQKYDGNIFDERGKLRPGGKKKLIPLILVLTLILGFVGGLLFWFSQPTEVTLTDSALIIEGGYGETVPYDEMEAVTLTYEPSLARRTNGAAVGSRLTGHFRTTNGEDVLVFIDRDIDVVVRIDWSGKPIYLNVESHEATEALYEEVRQK